MSNRPYPYYPVKEPGKGKLAGTEKFVELCRKRWGFTNLGTWVVRPMRGKKTLSVHSLGGAGAIGYPAPRDGRATAREAWAVLSPMLMTLAGGLIGLLAGNGLKDKPKDPPTGTPVP